MYVFLAGVVRNGTESEFSTLITHGELAFVHSRTLKICPIVDSARGSNQVAHCGEQHRHHARRCCHFPVLYRSLQMKYLFYFCIDKECMYMTASYNSKWRPAQKNIVASSSLCTVATAIGLALVSLTFQSPTSHAESAGVN